MNSLKDTEVETFTAKITKVWKGYKGEAGKKATFKFKNGDNTIPVDLVTEEAAGDITVTEDSTTVTKTVELPKFNPDNSLASYEVTEENVPGFDQEPTAPKTVNEENPEVSFTNIRQKKDITVTKEWPDIQGVKPKAKIKVTGESGEYKVEEEQVVQTDIHSASATITFKVPVTDLEGNEITYTAKEVGEEDGQVLIGDDLYNVEYPENNVEDQYIIKNTYVAPEGETIKITVVKKWANEKLDSAKFVIKDKDGNQVGDELILNEDNGWKLTREVPMYKAGTQEIAKYTVEEVGLSKAFKSDCDFYGEIFRIDRKVAFTNYRRMGKVKLVKRWVGEVGERATFVLKSSLGGVDTVTLPNMDDPENPSWEKTLTLPAYSLEGTPITYTIREEAIEGYQIDETTKEFSFDANGDFDSLLDPIEFTNIQIVNSGDYEVTKTWIGEPADAVSFGLFDGNKLIKVLTLTPADVLESSGGKVWKGKFEGNIESNDGNDNPIEYIVRELKAVTLIMPDIELGNDDQSDLIAEDGSLVTLSGRTYRVSLTNPEQGETNYQFTNKEVKTGNITVTKKWVGRPMPGLRVGLFKKVDLEEATSKPVAVQVINIPGVATSEAVTFDNVDLIDEEGNKIEYVAREIYTNDIILDENEAEPFILGNRKYKVSYSDREMVITNTELIDITVKKSWAKNVPATEIKPVEVQLTPGLGKASETVELNELNDWQQAFENLPYLETGYSVKETKINGKPVEDPENLFKIYMSLDGLNWTETNVMTGITDTTDISIENSLNIPDPTDNNIKVIKHWEAGATPASITAIAYVKEGDEWEPRGETQWTDVEGDVWEGEIDIPKQRMMDPTADYYVLETSIAGEELTQDEINSLLDKFVNKGKVSYEIDGYYVLVQRIPGYSNKVLINNISNKINVTKDWGNTPDSYKKPVTVQLYKEVVNRDGDLELEPVGEPIVLTEETNWAGWFGGVKRIDEDGEPIKYHVAEVKIGDSEKDSPVTVEDIANGYVIGPNGLYKVRIENDGTDDVIVKNEIERTDVWAIKLWAEGAPKVPVEFTLFAKKGDAYTKATDSAIVAVDANPPEIVFTGVPKLDENGEEISYYVFERKIGETVANHNYSNNYTVKVPGGTYTVDIPMNGVAGGTDRICIKNSYTPDPSDDTPGYTPPIPYDPGDTPPTSGDDTPSSTSTDTTVNVPSEPTPQGNATEDDEDGIIDDIDEDDVEDDTSDDVEVAEDDIPQGTTGLPKTGGTTGGFLALVGMGLIGLGLVTKKRK